MVVIFEEKSGLRLKVAATEKCRSDITKGTRLSSSLCRISATH